jgi:CheY-like chemotaxis protein
MLLEHYGHIVDSACSGSAALALAAKHPPDVVLLDLNMPVMDGFATARQLRKETSTASVLIVAVSGYVSDKAWCDRAIAAGVDGCLGKPIDYEKLEALLRADRHSRA